MSCRQTTRANHEQKTMLECETRHADVDTPAHWRDPGIVSFTPPSPRGHAEAGSRPAGSGTSPLVLAPRFQDSEVELRLPKTKGKGTQSRQELTSIQILLAFERVESEEVPTGQSRGAPCCPKLPLGPKWLPMHPNTKPHIHIWEWATRCNVWAKLATCHPCSKKHTPMTQHCRPTHARHVQHVNEEPNSLISCARPTLECPSVAPPLGALNDGAKTAHSPKGATAMPCVPTQPKATSRNLKV